MKLLLRSAFVGILLIIAYSTLVPIELRPVSGLSANAERLIAYLLLGFSGTLAFPRHARLIVGVIAVTAIGLELLQWIDPTRHARVMDAVVKIVGGFVGAVAGDLLLRVPRLRLSRD